MKKIITAKARVSMMPHQRSLRRLFKRKFVSAIKRQDKALQQELLDELMQVLQDIENKLEILVRTMALKVGRNRRPKVEKNG
jgi:hypothetical protein